jgi:predicted  nucleic acid-binding Zn-ribbon protein
MKPLTIIVATIGFLLIPSCEKRESPASPKTSKSPTGTTESELIETKGQMASVLDEQKSRITLLERDISEMKEFYDKYKSELAFLDAEKKKMMDDGLKLKKRWEQETQGIFCELSRPIHEQFRELTQRMDQLLQENQELKRKLEEATK